MQYLHDKGFRVLVLNQLGYDKTNNVFYVKNVPMPATTTSRTTTTIPNSDTNG
ncbi:MAG: hypothetical protein M3044_03555 [Thermoproteota archaeon]|nr:hypothetical protein [Thermoproteota archaeon]